MSFAIFFSLASSIAGFFIVIVLALSSRKFLKGEIKDFVELLMFGCLFLYAFTLSQFIKEFFSIDMIFLDIARGVLVFGSFIFFVSAAIHIYEIAEALGFASGKVPKKLKKILDSK
jgi:hypothetical protein